MKSRGPEGSRPKHPLSVARLRRKTKRLIKQVGADLGLLPPKKRSEQARGKGPALVPKPAPIVRATARLEQPFEVVSMTRETPDALTLELRPRGGPAVAYEAGQFLTLGVTLGREKLWRSYSMCTAPESGKLAVTIKRMPEGRVSAYLHQFLREGHEIEARGPAGRFTLPEPSGPRVLVLLGAGSGITPLMSHLGHALAVQPETSITLIYGNRSARDVIFAEALTHLCAAHPTRLRVRHVLEDVTDAAGPLAAAAAGRLDEAMIEGELAACGVIDAADHEYLVCGPEPMMVAARAVLARRGVPEERVHFERFTSPHDAHGAGAEGESHEVTVVSRKRSQVFQVRAQETVLEAAQRSGVDLEFSCQAGSCGACIIYLRAGEVELDEPNCLTPRERSDGKILTCSARARSALHLQKI